MLIIIDDCADDPAFTRQSKMLHTLYIRGRRTMINTITATQRFNALRPTVKANATKLFVYRLRAMKNLDTFIDEVSDVVEEKTLMELYHAATSEPYSCLHVKLTTVDKD